MNDILAIVQLLAATLFFASPFVLIVLTDKLYEKLTKKQ